jgi:rhodanese-related sulfurtransferase
MVKPEFEEHMTTSHEVATKTAIHLLPPAEVARALQAGEVRNFIDVRTPAEFAAVHASGARLVPFDQLDPAQLMATRQSPDEPIHLICQSGGRQAKAAQLLVEAGCANVVCVEGGTDAWIKAGMPVIRGGGKVISLERQVRIVAGAIVLIGVILGFAVHRAFFGFAGLVGAGLVFAGITDTCGMGMLLARMPWNRRDGSAGGGGCSTSTKTN